MDTIGEAYIPIAFKAAAAADPSAKLYYNDYNLEYLEDKTWGAQRIVELVRSYGARIDGVGFQGHFELGSTPPAADLAEAIRAITDMGVDVAFTEMDVRMKTPATTQKLQQHAKEYGGIAEACLMVPRCIGITIWVSSGLSEDGDEADSSRAYRTLTPGCRASSAARVPPCCGTTRTRRSRRTTPSSRRSSRPRLSRAAAPTRETAARRREAKKKRPRSRREGASLTEVRTAARRAGTRGGRAEATVTAVIMAVVVVANRSSLSRAGVMATAAAGATEVWARAGARAEAMVGATMGEARDRAVEARRKEAAKRKVREKDRRKDRRKDKAAMTEEAMSLSRGFRIHQSKAPREEIRRLATSSTQVAGSDRGSQDRREMFGGQGYFIFLTHIILHLYLFVSKC
jgi:hypothetical protein